MSAFAIISRVRRLQKLRAERLAKPTTKRLTREQERERARLSGRDAPLFPEYFDDPVGFAEKVLGVRLWRKQKRILLSIARHEKVAIRSGQKTGKTTAFIVAALWWAATRTHGRVLLTAPGNKQVRNILWKELRRIVYSRSPDGRYVYEVLGVEPALLPSTGMQWPDGREIIGFAADVPENMQGFSGPEMLTIIDEGSGVENAIFEVIEGNSAAGGKIATASQPTKQTGWFFDAFHANREFWVLIEISSEETPNVTGEEEPIPGLATADYCAKRKAEYGETSQFYLIRIKGQFAGTASNAIIGLSLIESARQRYEANDNAESEDVLNLGLDVARFGDDESALTPRRGNRVYPIRVVHGFDTIAIVGLVMEVVRDMRRPGEVPELKIDSSGGYGSGVADLLRAEHGREVAVYELNASEQSDDPEQFTNLRSQLHFATAEFLKEGGELPEDRKLEAELLTPTYGFDTRARRKVESKDEIKKRLKRSPDRADSLALAIYKATFSRGIGAGRSPYRFAGGRGY
mgnify:CR=1 FL=1